MNTVLKSILAGVLLGAALFIMPFFLIRFFIFVLIVGALFRLFGGGRYRREWGYGGNIPAFADRIRQMSDEEYAEFKNGFQGPGYCGSKGTWPTAKKQEKENQETTNA